MNGQCSAGKRLMCSLTNVLSAKRLHKRNMLSEPKLSDRTCYFLNITYLFGARFISFRLFLKGFHSSLCSLILSSFFSLILSSSCSSFCSSSSSSSRITTACLFSLKSCVGAASRSCRKYS